MKLDSLVNAVKAADFSALRDIALLCLTKRGFEPGVVDGPHDGGADFLVYNLPPSAAKYAVQISVEKDWEKKLRADAAKARRKLGVDDLLFISTRIITEPAFRAVADDLVRTLDVRVQKMDAKDIASLAQTRGFAAEILRTLDLPVAPTSPRPFQPSDLRQDVAYACAFFGTDAQEFRKVVVENATLAAVFHAGGSADRSTAVQRAALSLGLASNQQAQVTSAIDRMLGDGRLSGKNGTVTLDRVTKDAWESTRALREHGHRELGEGVERLLAPLVKNQQARSDAVGVILTDLGALFLDAGRATSDALGAEASALGQSRLRERLRHLAATLDTLGVVDRGRREKLLRDLSALAAASPFGRALVAGEVFINLVGLKTPHLFRAFGGDKRLQIVLDTSVAMPLLCALLFDAAEQDFFVAAKHAYDQIVAHRGTMVLPKDYLEEVASHLLDAYSLYRDIVELDPDLRGSRNAFVAHYAALRGGSGQALPYATYLRGFGLSDAIARGEGARELLMNKLKGSFKRYNIETRALSATASSLTRAQGALAFAIRERDDRRPPLLVRHDANTLGWLLDHASDPDDAYVICTWDKLHPSVQAREDADWDVLDPVALGDVLSLAAPDGEDTTILSPVVLALSLSAEAEQNGAAVWDKLVALEREKLHDATLRDVAYAFKKDWVEKTLGDRRARNLQDAWEAWKKAHLPPLADPKT
jgi:hypothetical protein